MGRPRHGFDRNASHTEDRYVCDCGYDDCEDADFEWMMWAENRIAGLEHEYIQRKLEIIAIKKLTKEWCVDASELRLGQGDDPTCRVEADTLEKCAAEIDRLLDSKDANVESGATKRVEDGDD